MKTLLAFWLALLSASCGDAANDVATTPASTFEMFSNGGPIGTTWTTTKTTMTKRNSSAAVFYAYGSNGAELSGELFGPLTVGSSFRVTSTTEDVGILRLSFRLHTDTQSTLVPYASWSGEGSSSAKVLSAEPLTLELIDVHMIPDGDSLAKEGFTFDAFGRWYKLGL